MATTGTRKRIASQVSGGQIAVSLLLVLVALAAVSVLAVPAISTGRGLERPDASEPALGFSE